MWLVRDKAGEYLACKVVYRESFQHDRPYEREYEGICKFEPVSLSSESQVKILHVGRRDADGCFYYIMELADDASAAAAFQPDTYIPKTLQSELERRGRLPAAECIQIGLSLSAALENLHQHGLVHRDIKPANIIFVKGVPKLADIGLVTDADVTVSYVGTGGFIPPEGPSSPQADVYGLGKVLYEISTGKDRMQYPELPANIGDLPDRQMLLELNAIVVKACEADTRKRYASARELQRDLMLLQSGKSIRQIRSSMKLWALAARMAASLILILLLAAGTIYLLKKPPGTDRFLSIKSPLPDAARLAQCEARIRRTFALQLGASKNAPKQLAAAELVRQSAAAEDPAMQLASLRVAALLAAEAGDFPLAMQICQKMGDRFQMDSLPVKAELLAQAVTYARTPAKKVELAAVCVKTGFEALAADDYDSGTKLTEAAKASIQDCGDSRLVQEAGFLDAEMTRCRDAFARVKPFEAVRRSNPDDPEACLEVGKFLCFAKNDWEAGLPLMAHATNASLKMVLATEINQNPKTPEQKIALATSWRELAGSAPVQDKTFYQQRARYWYLKGLAAYKKQDRDLVRQQWNDSIQSLPPNQGEIHIFSRLDGTESIDIYSDEVRWKSGRGAVSSKINQVRLDDLKPGELVIIKNSEATRLFSEQVDFSTARLIINRKPKSKGQGRAKLETAPDHVRVTLVHPGGGFAELEVTVAFGSPP